VPDIWSDLRGVNDDDLEDDEEDEEQQESDPDEDEDEGDEETWQVSPCAGITR
jgi:hypothetical protein